MAIPNSFFLVFVLPPDADVGGVGSFRGPFGVVVDDVVDRVTVAGDEARGRPEGEMDLARASLPFTLSASTRVVRPVVPAGVFALLRPTKGDALCVPGRGDVVRALAGFDWSSCNGDRR